MFIIFFKFILKNSNYESLILIYDTNNDTDIGVIK